MGRGGGHGPRAQALEGAPAQLLGANFKTEIRPRQISKVTSLQRRINLAAKVAYAMGPALPMGSLGGLSFLFLAEDFFLFFFAGRFFSPGADAGFTKRRGGGSRTPSSKGASRVGLCGGGGGADASIGPRALETLGTPLLLTLKYCCIGLVSVART